MFKGVPNLKYFILSLITGLFLLGPVQNGLAQCSGIDFKASTTKGCVLLTVTFTAKGAPGGSSYDWDLGFGLLTGKKDTITGAYSSPGKYKITMVAHLPSGATCTVVKDTFITVLAAPTPVMKVTPGFYVCDVDRTVLFTDSTPNSAKRQWVIEGNSYYNQKVSYNFLNAGTQNVTLNVTDKNGCIGIVTKPLYIYDSIPVDFCANINIPDPGTVNASFSPETGATQGRTILGYLWQFPGGTPSASTSSNPKVSYPSATKSYDVTLTVFFSGGCSYTMVHKGFISPYITPLFSNQCISKQLNVLANSTGGRTGFQFSFPGASAAGPLPGNVGYNVTYPSPADYGMSISFSYNSTSTASGLSCPSNVSYVKYITMLGPKADFASNDNQLCFATDTVHLKNISDEGNAPNVKYTWYFENISTGSIIKMGPTRGRDTIFIPHNNSSYNVTLVARSSNGCFDSVSKKLFITVSTPQADFKVDNTSACFDGNSIVLESKPNPPEPPNTALYKYYWRITSELDSNNWTPAYTNVVFFSPPLVGKYDVLLDISNGHCRSEIIKKAAFNILGDNAIISISDTLGCLTPDFKTTLSITKETTYPAVLSAPPVYRWHSYPGDEGIVHFDDTTSKTTHVSITKSGCRGIYVDITIFTATDTCTVTYKKNVCAGVPIYFIPAEFKIIDPTKATPWHCAGDTLKVNNATDPAASRFKWTVAPADQVTILPSDTARNISIVYKKDTCYTIKLQAWMNQGGFTCTDTLTEKVCLVGPKPDFYTITPDFYCAPAIIKFINTSSKKQAAPNDPGKILSTQLYFWQFGDGSTLLTKNDTVISHVYLQQLKPAYDITLTAFDTTFTDKPACSNTVIKRSLITVTGPVPHFDVNSHAGCDSLLVKFTNGSHNVKKFYFFDGDGGSADSVNLPSHTYRLQDPALDSITYYPTLLSKDDSACRVFFRDSIKIYRPPQDINIKSDIHVGCVPFQAHFKGTARAGSTWKWDFDGDGVIDDSVQNPVFTFLKPGRYRPKVFVGNHGHCYVAVWADTIVAVPSARASLEPGVSAICGQGEVLLANTSASYQHYSLDYGDGSPKDSDRINRHLYYNTSDTGSIVLYPRLIVYNTAGCSDTAKARLTVYPALRPGFTVSALYGCSPMKVRFQDTTHHTFATAWDFDNDGKNDAYGRVADWVYPAGIYNVSMKTTALTGCSDSILRTSLIRVNQSPAADFSPADSDVCYRDTVHFINRTFPAAGVVKWLWNFGSAADTSSALNPAFSFHSKGLQTITLMATDDKGCTGLISKQDVYVEDTLIPGNSDLLNVSVLDSHSVIITWAKNDFRLFGKYRIIGNTGGAKHVVLTKIQVDDTSAVFTDPSLNTHDSSYCFSLQTENRCGRISYASFSHCTIWLTGNAQPDGNNKLSWTSYIGWSPAKYNIYRTGADGQEKLADTVPGNKLAWTDTAACNEAYRYRVEAAEDIGRFTSNSNSITLKTKYTLQNRQVTLRYATTDNDAVIIRWDTIAYARLKKYSIDRYDLLSGWQNDYASTTSNRFTDKNVDIYAYTYTYKIKTMDRCGYNSPAGNEGISIVLKQNISNNKIQLGWNSYKHWPAGVKNYDLQIRLKPAVFKTIRSLNDTFYTDDSVYNSIDTAYCYRVIAHESGGNNDSSVSNQTCALFAARIFVPNAFTPFNNDTLNREWKPIALGVHNAPEQELTAYSAKVFNRWGMLMFQTHDLHHGWDGRWRGNRCPADVYIYIIDAQGVDGKNIHLRGNITLIN